MANTLDARLRRPRTIASRRATSALFIFIAVVAALASGFFLWVLAFFLIAFVQLPLLFVTVVGVASGQVPLGPPWWTALNRRREFSPPRATTAPWAVLLVAAIVATPPLTIAGITFSTLVQAPHRFDGPHGPSVFMAYSLVLASLVLLLVAWFCAYFPGTPRWVSWLPCAVTLAATTPFIFPIWGSGADTDALASFGLVVNIAGALLSSLTIAAINAVSPASVRTGLTDTAGLRAQAAAER